MTLVRDSHLAPGMLAMLVFVALATRALAQETTPAAATEPATTGPAATATTETGPAETAPATSPAVEWELPEAVRTALAQVQDFAFNFDQPGFLAVLAYAKTSPRSPGFAQTPLAVTDWRDLLERPGDFRGRPVTVTGIIGRNKDPYRLAGHPELGYVTQVELRRDDQPLACTLILTEGAGDVPVNATVQVTGYFVMIRQYYGPSNRVQQAALLVAPGPSSITWQPPQQPAAEGPDWRWMLGAVAIGVLITIVLLRRTASGGRHDVHELRARRAAPVSLADDLDEWAKRERPDSSASGDEPRPPNDEPSPPR